MSNRTHTDSVTVEHHDDGSWTETSTITRYPASTGQKAAAIGTIAVIGLMPLLPLVTVMALEKIEERREARRARKKAANLNVV